MASIRLPAARAAWYQPFVFVLLLPLLTVPATVALLWSVLACQRPPDFCDMICTLDCPTIPTIGTLAPGLLGLLCWGWSRSSRRDVRQAASIATGFAVVRVLAPAVNVLVGGSGDGWTTPMALATGIGIAGGFSILISPLLWMLTLAAFIAFGIWGRERPPIRVMVANSDTSDEAFRSFAAEALTEDPSAQFGPVLSQWRAPHSSPIPLRDSLRRVFDEEQRRASR